MTSTGTTTDVGRDARPRPSLRARTRLLAVVALAGSLALTGTATAWAWWQTSSPLATVTASTVVVPPATGVVTCDEQATSDVWGLYNNRVNIGWSASGGLATGASARRYLVRLTAPDGSTKDKYVADTALTSFFTNTDIAPPATTTYSLRVYAVADYGSPVTTSWLSAPIGTATVTATRRTFLFWVYYDLACG